MLLSSVIKTLGNSKILEQKAENYWLFSKFLEESFFSKSLLLEELSKEEKSARSQKFRETVNEGLKICFDNIFKVLNSTPEGIKLSKEIDKIKQQNAQEKKDNKRSLEAERKLNPNSLAFSSTSEEGAITNASKDKVENALKASNVPLSFSYPKYKVSTDTTEVVDVKTTLSSFLFPSGASNDPKNSIYALFIPGDAEEDKLYGNLSRLIVNAAYKFKITTPLIKKNFIEDEASTLMIVRDAICSTLLTPSIKIEDKGPSKVFFNRLIDLTAKDIMSASNTQHYSVDKKGESKTVKSVYSLDQPMGSDATSTYLDKIESKLLTPGQDDPEDIEEVYRDWTPAKVKEELEMLSSFLGHKFEEVTMLQKQADSVKSNLPSDRASDEYRKGMKKIDALKLKIQQAKDEVTEIQDEIDKLEGYRDIGKKEKRSDSNFSTDALEQYIAFLSQKFVELQKKSEEVKDAYNTGLYDSTSEGDKDSILALQKSLTKILSETKGYYQRAVNMFIAMTKTKTSIPQESQEKFHAYMADIDQKKREFTHMQRELIKWITLLDKHLERV